MKTAQKKIILFIAFCVVTVLFLKGVDLFAQTAISPIETKAVPVPLPLEEKKMEVPLPTPLQQLKLIEVELKEAKDLPMAPEGCKNLCGDGICQEIVCMALGCPCPETPESCPQDCQKTKEGKETVVPVLPVIQLPSATKVEINPKVEKPVLIENKVLEVKGLETKEMPKISVQVQTPGAKETNVQIEIDKETKLIKIEHENITAVTAVPIKIEEKTIKIETPKREISVSVLPSLATQVVIQKEPQKIENVYLKVENEIPVYETKGVKSEKFLGILPVKIPVQTKVDAQVGKIIKVQKSIWAKILDLFSF